MSVWDYNNNQQHFTYRDASGNIQDVWYDGGGWNLQQLTGTTPTCPQPGLCTANEQIRVFAAPAATGNVFASVYKNQQHVTYRDTSNNIQDVWYDGSGGWNLQELAGR